MSAAIQLINIRKSFRKKQVLRGVTLAIQPGEVLGLLGPNGAGKSSLIKIMTGLLAPDDGDVKIFGRSLAKNKRLLRQSLGLAPQAIAVYPQLTVAQNLRSFGTINGLSGRQVQAKYDQVLPIFGLQDLQTEKAADLSGGQKRRLHSAIALMGPAKIIFLDEPTVGADVDSRNRIIAAVRHLSDQGITVVYTTHYLAEMAALHARIAFLNHGVIQATGSTESIIRQYAHPAVTLSFKGRLPAGLPGWEKDADHLRAAVPAAASPAQLLQTALMNPAVQDAQLTDVQITQADLESAYHTLLERDAAHVD